MLSAFLKKSLILVSLFWFLAIFQESFLSHFEIFGARLNLILVTVFLLSFIDQKPSPQVDEEIGIPAGFLGGFFLDLTASSPLGIFTLTLGILSFLIKKLGNFFQKSNILSFFLIFLLSFFFYKFASQLFQGIFNLFFQKDFNLPLSSDLNLLLLEFLYNFLLAGLIFIFAKKYGFLSEK
jgi:rod shape-determining protein MreD